MCDNPSVLALTGLTQNWIALAKIKGDNDAASHSGIQPNVYMMPEDQSILDDEVFPFLDSPLRPATPDTNDSRSMALYEEHKQLAKEYFKVQSELARYNQEKNSILDQQLKEHEQQEDLQKEYESLLQLKNYLVAQKEGFSANVNNRSREHRNGSNRTN